ncbi:lipopolysaccharide assembly protein LapB [Comamonas serinivorans]|uniref:Lipopolysaccharide assembly protein B n=1 Tax=Comamonas serinivorans TaxID=1082851 RepID=A0A1Y0ERA4_9BURK|nr:lipopolysaccharide assembly protein LapB [Comamonas serinivorans]ARU06187.1 lipopolysaccharide assembly protein LapB [Comamonas serinivorans]
MAFDLTWILLGFPIAFALGWFASRLDVRQSKTDYRQAPKAYFKGLNYLLNEQQDRAIDAFIEAVQSDPDTSDLHFALGSLFRRRGDYDRAVRVHQHLLARGDLSREDHARAQHALAMDYLTAGLLDHAENALIALRGTSFEQDALVALLAIYERARDWPKAADIARELQQRGAGDFHTRIAHFLCEQAATALTRGERDAGLALLRQANAEAPAAPRPYLDSARWHAQQQDFKAAYDRLVRIAQQAPHAMPLAAHALAQAAQASAQQAGALAVLKLSYEQQASIDVLDAIVSLAPHPPNGRAWYIRHLEQHPSLLAATRWLEDEPLHSHSDHALVQRALTQAGKPLSRYRCTQCGFESATYFWQCPGCQSWDSFPPKRLEEL